MKTINQLQAEIKRIENEYAAEHGRGTIKLTVSDKNYVSHLNKFIALLEIGTPESFFRKQLETTSRLVDRIEESFRPDIAGVYPTNLSRQARYNTYARKTGLFIFKAQCKALTFLLN